MPGPITLTPPQFYKKRPRDNYQNYLRYINARRSQKLSDFQQYGDPRFAPRPTRLLLGDARRYVQQQIDPLISEINRSIAQRSTQGQAAIRNYTDFFSNRLSQYADRTRSDQAGALATAGALGSGMAQAAQGQGAAASSEIAQKLAAFGAPGGANNPVGQQVLGRGATAVGNASMGSFIDVNRINETGSAASAYAGALPSVGVLAGAQHSRDLQGQLNTMQQDQIGKVRSEVPGLVERIYESLVNRELQKAIASTGYKAALSGQQITASGNLLDYGASVYNTNARANAAKDKAKTKAGQDASKRLAADVRFARTHGYQIVKDIKSGQRPDKRDLIQMGGRLVPNPNKGKVAPVSWQQAYSQVYAYLSSALGGRVDEPTLDMLAQEILDTAGITRAQTRIGGHK